MEYKKLKTLLIYLVYRNGIQEFYEAYIKILNSAGFDVEGFCITLDPPGPRLTYSELDRKWKRRDKKLARMYERLNNRANTKEVLVLYNGANLHPELLKELRTFNAYMCFDDPESSQDLSEPVAKYFDSCFVGNIASLTQYESWNCKNIFFRPLGYFSNYASTNLVVGNSRSVRRDIDVSIFCERESKWRQDRLSYIETHLPNLYARGKGWKGGFASDKEMLEVYLRSKIGLNIHNSTGPINLRLYALPANSVMQICDNKYFLGQIFTLGKEVVGFCDIEEVPELVNYYLKNESERNNIAYRGWLRASKEYNEVAVWDRQMKQISNLL